MESPTIDVRDKVVVITGAARGMGRADTRGFLKEGAKVVASDLSWEGADDFKDELKTYDNIVTMNCDISKDADVDRLYQATLDRFGTVDVLLNNAGMLQMLLYPPPHTGRTKVLETKDADWEKMFSVNVFGTLKMVRRFIQPMIEKRRGSIVNISSSGAAIVPITDGVWTALRPNSLEQPYMSSKAALMNWSLYLADEVKEHNVAVNVVFPGHSEMHVWRELDVARKDAGMRAPQRVMPEHIVPLMLFLAQQDATTGITGRVLDWQEWSTQHGLGGHARWTREALEGQAARVTKG